MFVAFVMFLFYTKYLLTNVIIKSAIFKLSVGRKVLDKREGSEGWGEEKKTQK